MFTKISFAILLISPLAFSCPDHGSPMGSSLMAKRAEGVKDWAYDASYDWGSIKSEYAFCQNGTNQSPIQLPRSETISAQNFFNFNFPGITNGSFTNWGYGPSFNLPTTTDYSSYPSVTFSEGGKAETVFLKGWHIHAPGEHSVEGDRTRAELHYVFANAEGKERAVFGIRIDPSSSTESAFISQLPPLISYHDTGKHENVELNLGLALSEVENFQEFWTYKGSLTSPPCTEGLRWFVAKDVLKVSNTQMQSILTSSKFSARVIQEVWSHEVNAL